MAAALQTRTVEARGDTVMAELTAVEATRARDALCRALYNRLFTWIVNRANEAIKVRLELRGPSGSGGPALGGLTVRAQCDISLDRCCNCNAGGMSSDSLYGEGADFFFRMPSETIFAIQHYGTFFQVSPQVSYCECGDRHRGHDLPLLH